MATDVGAKKGEIPKQYNYNQHFRELIKEICTCHKKDGYDNFENISIMVREKNTNLNFQFVKEETKVKRSFQLTPLEEKVLNEFANNKPKKAKLVSNYMDDIMAQSKLFEWGGVSFSEEEWFKIQMAMKKLMLKNDCEYIRLFGKIFGIFCVI